MLNFKHNIIAILFMAVITFILSTGLTIISSVNSGLKVFYTDNITGDYVIMAKSPEIMTIFGALNPIIGDFIEIPQLQKTDEINDYLTALPYIKSTTTQISGSALLKIGPSSYPVPFFGIDPKNYFEFFKGVEVVEGASFKSEENGILINIDQKGFYEKELGKELIIGSPLLLTVFGNSGFKIKEVILTGFYKYTDGSKNFNKIVLIDPGTARKLNTIFEYQEVKTTPNETDLLTEDYDDIFSDYEPKIETEYSSDSLIDSILSDNFIIEDSNITISNWNFILVSTNKNIKIKNIKKDLKIKFKDLLILSWKDAAGQVAIIGKLMLYFFIGGFLLVCFAGGIGIVNIITLSVINRTRELGMIRSLGAQKTFVFKLILTEVLIISILGSIIGNILGFGTIKILNTLKIILPGELLKSIFGGNVLIIKISIFSIICNGLFAIFFGLLASIYPLKKTLEVSPLQAINKV